MLDTKRLWRLPRLALVFASLAVSPAFAETCDRTISVFCSGDPGVAVVTGPAGVTDGETIRVGPIVVRLWGIDAPEAGQTCGTLSGGSWPCGERATERLAHLSRGETVRCLGRQRDPYGRLLAVCIANGEQLNARIVRDGLAWAFVRYSRDYVDLEAEARARQVGVWQAPSEAPWDYREKRWQRASAESPRPGCPIKGNINNNGEKIYHTPWSPAYDRTRIDESAGERWFCDEGDALAAGWRPAKWR